MKNSTIKKILCLLAVIAVLFAFGLCAIASSDSEGSDDDQGSDDASKNENTSNLGNYNVIIKSCRLSEDYEGNPIAIITYAFTNNDKDPANFSFTFDHKVYQDGIGLNECLFASENANYNSDNQLKDIKQGATLEVEVAYELNDTTADLEVEVSELISFDEKIVKKTYKISE